MFFLLIFVQWKYVENVFIKVKIIFVKMCLYIMKYGNVNNEKMLIKINIFFVQWKWKISKNILC